MNFDQWKVQLAKELGRIFDMDGLEYIKQTGEECWLEMFNEAFRPKMRQVRKPAQRRR
jgi:hypothetical protein